MMLEHPAASEGMEACPACCGSDAGLPGQHISIEQLHFGHGWAGYAVASRLSGCAKAGRQCCFHGLVITWREKPLQQHHQLRALYPNWHSKPCKVHTRSCSMSHTQPAAGCVQGALGSCLRNPRLWAFLNQLAAQVYLDFAEAAVVHHRLLGGEDGRVAPRCSWDLNSSQEGQTLP